MSDQREGGQREPGGTERGEPGRTERAAGRRRWLGRGLALLFGLVLALAAAEAAVRIQGIDHERVRASIGLQGALPALHQTSRDGLLRYELRPGAADELWTLPDEGGREAWPAALLDENGGRSWPVRINQQGARGPDRPTARPAGTWRVLMMGGSTVFGSVVREEETMAGQLERLLNADPPAGYDRVEVWNYGVSGYVVSQMARLAQRGLQLDPQLIIMVASNRGPRLFLADEQAAERDYRPWFRYDPYAWIEQLPPPTGSVFDSLATGPERGDCRSWDFADREPPMPSWRERLYDTGLAHSAVFRLWAIAQQPASRARFRETCETRPGGCDELPWATALNRREALTLAERAEAAGTRVFYVQHSSDQRPPSGIFPELEASDWMTLWQPGRIHAYYEQHPPPHILGDYSAQIAAQLRERGWLEGR